jgi:hypothetical protein
MARRLYECDKPNCYFRLLLWEHESGDHQCPDPGGHTHYGLSVTMSLVSQCWEDLDGIMDQLMNPAGKVENPRLGESIWRTTDDHIKYERLRGQARGMAVLLARFMVPHFRTPDEIAAEAKRRWKCRQNGEDHTTAGLGSRSYDFPSDDKYKAKQPVAPLHKPRGPRQSNRTDDSQSKSLTAARAPQRDIPAAVRAGIIGAKGQMSSADLAMIYQLDKADVEAVWSQA